MYISLTLFFGSLLVFFSIALVLGFRLVRWESRSVAFCCWSAVCAYGPAKINNVCAYAWATKHNLYTRCLQKSEATYTPKNIQPQTAIYCHYSINLSICLVLWFIISPYIFTMFCFFVVLFAFFYLFICTSLWVCVFCRNLSLLIFFFASLSCCCCCFFACKTRVRNKRCRLFVSDEKSMNAINISAQKWIECSVAISRSHFISEPFLVRYTSCFFCSSPLYCPSDALRFAI